MDAEVRVADRFLLDSSIEWSLGQPPSMAGLRLKSERELATLLRTERTHVRQSIRRLVKKGILVQRHGSGTYVRKVPRFSDNAERMLPPRVSLLSAEALFAEAGKPHTRRRVHAAHRQLHLGLWSHIQTPSESEKLFLDGVIQQTRESGHQVTLHSVVEKPGVLLSVENLAELLKRHPCDGYLMLSGAAEIFSRAIGGVRPPTVFMGVPNALMEYQPMIQVDLLEAVTRAIRRFAAEGYTRIGMIGLDSETDTARPALIAYEQAMSQMGSDYRASDACRLGCGAVARGIQRMFLRADAPDALYVADDIVLREAVPALADVGREPGRNLGVITLSNQGNSLPPGYDWSRLEFNPAGVGRMAADILLRVIETAGEEMFSFTHQAAWREGKTFRRPGASDGGLDLTTPASAVMGSLAIPRGNESLQ